MPSEHVEVSDLYPSNALAVFHSSIIEELHIMSGNE